MPGSTFQLGLGFILLDHLPDLVFHFIQIRNSRIALFEEHGNRKTILDSRAFSHVAGVVESGDCVLELLRASDVGYIVAGFYERRVAHHVRRTHVRFGSKFLGNFLWIFCFLQTILHFLSNLLGNGVTTSISYRNK